MPMLKFTQSKVDKLRLPETGQVQYMEKLRRGRALVLCLSYGGTMTWRVLFYLKGKPRSTSLGKYPDLSIADAKELAWQYNPIIDETSFKAIASQYMKTHRPRTRDEATRLLDKYCYPELGNLPIVKVRKKEVYQTLNKVPGKVQPSEVLGLIRAILNWYEATSADDDYEAPRLVSRDTRPVEERSRSRVLSDEEIRILWSVCSRANWLIRGQFVKSLLFTAQRRAKCASIRNKDLADNVWSIATESGEKSNAEVLILPEFAMRQCIEPVQHLPGQWLFPSSWDVSRHFATWDHTRDRIWDEFPNNSPRWSLHDIRRTARTLLSRAGVQADIAERVLGHSIPGVRGIYDRHTWTMERKAALQVLSDLVATIIR